MHGEKRAVCAESQMLFPHCVPAFFRGPLLESRLFAGLSTAQIAVPQGDVKLDIPIRCLKTKCDSVGYPQGGTPLGTKMPALQARKAGHRKHRSRPSSNER